MLHLRRGIGRGVPELWAGPWRVTRGSGPGCIDCWGERTRGGWNADASDSDSSDSGAYNASDGMGFLCASRSSDAFRSGAAGHAERGRRAMGVPALLQLERWVANRVHELRAGAQRPFA